jgi:hypothetical protein
MGVVLRVFEEYSSDETYVDASPPRRGASVERERYVSCTCLTSVGDAFHLLQQRTGVIFASPGTKNLATRHGACQRLVHTYRP